MWPPWGGLAIYQLVLLWPRPRGGSATMRFGGSCWIIIYYVNFGLWTQSSTWLAWLRVDHALGWADVRVAYRDLALGRGHSCRTLRMIEPCRESLPDSEGRAPRRTRCIAEDQDCLPALSVDLPTVGVIAHASSAVEVWFAPRLGVAIQ